ncbi:MAG: cytochrome c5 family protein, partial [Xanthomonadales bacterium]|nr:cytochrome c5 family protein [Xanthomonadales bacterium]
GIIVGLVIVTILIIVIAVGYDNSDPTANPSRAAMAAERVAPVGAVRTELPEAVAAPIAEVADDLAAAGDALEDIDGSAIYATVCQACHISGAAGAPIPGSEAWVERAAKGLDALTQTAISGIGAMPAKGGRLDLSDEEIRAAVEHMLEQ